MMQGKWGPGAAIALSAAAPAVIGALMEWHVAVRAFLALTTGSGCALLVMWLSTNSGAVPDDAAAGEDQPLSREPVRPEEQPFRRTEVREVPLASAVDGYDFHFSAAVWWRPLVDQALLSDSALTGLATSAIVRRAQEVAVREHPNRAGAVRHHLDGALGIPQTDGSATVTSLAADISVSLAPADQERLRKIDDLRKREEVWEHERQYERNKRAYLGDEVLKSPGSAVVWWLARHEDQVEGTVDMIGPLAQISAAANDREVSALHRHLVPSREAGRDGEERPQEEHLFAETMGTGETADLATMLRTMLDKLAFERDSAKATVLGHRFAEWLEAAGCPEAAQDLRRTFLGEEEPGAFGGDGPFVEDVPPEDPREEDGPAGSEGTERWAEPDDMYRPPRPPEEDRSPWHDGSDWPSYGARPGAEKPEKDAASGTFPGPVVPPQQNRREEGADREMPPTAAPRDDEHPG